ncbi:NAD(P)-dependent oxidoreductase [Streptomyces exfoliatus]|uniref:NAD(P)-dependent oxidoreductase n=1 Tax=Streptomyces exfoliatus TaxID=1905 RepID=UPI0004657707|nr:NAD(P)-binding domain-containing protein [Streptomyces exfoliatus]
MTTTAAQTDAQPPVTVTVLGLGEMGTALAHAFLAGGHPTTVWNRSPEKAGALVAEGAVRAATVREAVAAGSLVIVSVKGAVTARELLEASGDALSGRTVVNLTDGTSAEARAAAEWAGGRGARYLHGQIMTIAPGVGGAETVVFYGGSAADHDRFQSVLRLIGGRGTLIAEDAGVPALYGMAVHGTMWGALNGFLHASALLASEGIGTARFLDDARASVSSLLASLPFIADEVDSGMYATEYGALRHHRPSVEDLVRESAARNVDTGFPRYTLGLVDKALAEGHGDDSYARLVEHFRR